MAYLSRDDIEKIAESVIGQYKERYLPECRMCYMVDASELAEMLGFRIEYVHITKDGSILGQTSSGRIWTEIYDDNMNKIFFELDGSTILVDKRLLSNPKITGRKNFTIAHEIAHQIINRQYPEMYDPQNRTFCDYRRSVKPKKKIVDWHEWQADALAAALLLPLDALKDGMFMFGLGEKMKMLTRADFQSDEEFQKWKSWSDENYRVTENKNYTYRYHSVSTEVIRDKALSSPSLDDIYLYEEERIEKLADLLLYSEAVEYIKALLTATQFRRLWLYCVEELTEEEIPAFER